MSYNYNIFGVNVRSDIDILILDKSKHPSEIINISIHEDNILEPELILFQEKGRNFYITNLKKTEIYIKNVALFNINNKGSSIKYILEKNADMTSFFSKLLNHVIPYALYMQKKFILHASGVAFRNNGFIFLGKSGAGKSSLAASLKKMSFVCEDSALIDIVGKELFLTPSFNLVKLSTEIYETLELKNNKIDNIQVDKLNRNLYKVNNFLDQKVRLKNCYILEWGQEFKIEKANSSNIIGEVYASVFGPHPFNSCKESELIIYKQISNILKNINFYRLYRNKNSLFSDNDSIIRHIETEDL